MTRGPVQNDSVLYRALFVFWRWEKLGAVTNGFGPERRRS
jgi:hypothetical protein